MSTQHYTFSVSCLWFIRAATATDGARLQTYTGFFKYDSADDEPQLLPPVAENFGLKDNKTWTELVQKLNELNAAGNGSSYKLLFANRHGQGYHNVAEAEYGTADWDAYWSKLDGDGKITWGPDAQLTPLGVTQAQEVNNGWKTLLAQKDAPPVPTKLFVSPLSRAIYTQDVTYAGVLTILTLVMEGFREHYGEHTCDKRSTKSLLYKENCNIEYEPHFTEEDELWTETRETEEHLDIRIHEALEDVWNNNDDSVIGLTSHSGVMQSLFRVTHHYPINPSTGAMVPLIIKATPLA